MSLDASQCCLFQCGLSNAQAQRRLRAHGPNKLVAPAIKRPFLEILKRLRNSLVLRLLVAGAVSAAVGETLSAGIITLMVVLSAAFDYLQELNIFQLSAPRTLDRGNRHPAFCRGDSIFAPGGGLRLCRLAWAVFPGLGPVGGHVSDARAMGKNAVLSVQAGAGASSEDRAGDLATALLGARPVSGYHIFPNLSGDALPYWLCGRLVC